MSSGELIALTARDVESLLNVSHTAARTDMDGHTVLGLIVKVQVKSRYILPTDNNPPPPRDGQN